MKTLIQMKIIYFNLLKRNTSLQNNFATPQSNKNMKLGLAVKTGVRHSVFDLEDLLC